MHSDRFHPVVLVEDDAEFTFEAEIAALQGHPDPLPRNVGEKPRQAEMVRLHRQLGLLDELQQLLVGPELATLHHCPLLICLALDDGHEVGPFEDDQNSADESAPFEFAPNHRVADPEDIESMGFFVPPLPVDILAVVDVDEGGPFEFAAVPIRHVEGEIVIDEDAEPLATALLVGGALVPGILVVNLDLHSYY